MQSVYSTASRLGKILFLNEFELIYLHSRTAIVSVQLNGFNYCDLALIIQFNIYDLFVHSEGITSILIITNYSIQHVIPL